MKEGNATASRARRLTACMHLVWPGVVNLRFVEGDAPLPHTTGTLRPREMTFVRWLFVTHSAYS